MKNKCRIAIDPIRNTGVQGAEAVRGDINIAWGSRIVVTNERYKHFSPLHSLIFYPVSSKMMQYPNTKALWTIKVILKYSEPLACHL